jgi:4-diphosphocytidyl-2-C-methyl-D-erythritol kinase
MQQPFTLPSFAKINWSLRIVGKRDDGFHEICTAFQTVSLQDAITFSESRSVGLTCSNNAITTGEDNLCVRAARALQQRFSVDDGAAIHLEKQIPSPGGLGGGSSNAAVTLIGLSRLWRLKATRDDLLQIAAEIGSDVPFFLTGGTALGTGRGEIVEPIPELAASEMLVVTPDVDVSTAKAFAKLNAPNLTKTEPNRILRVCRLEAESLDLRHTELKNDFEPSAFLAYPEIRRVKETLLELGAVNAAMSGSGASVFAIFDKQETRQAAQKALEHESSWRKFAVATISRSSYREALQLQG